MKLHVSMDNDAGSKIEFEGTGGDLIYDVLQILTVVLEYEDFQTATELIGRASSFSKADFKKIKLDGLIKENTFHQMSNWKHT